MKKFLVIYNNIFIININYIYNYNKILRFLMIFWVSIRILKFLGFPKNSLYL